MRVTLLLPGPPVNRDRFDRSEIAGGQWLVARRLLLAAVFCLAALALADLGVCPAGSTVAQDVAPCAGLDGPGHGPDQHWHDGRGVSAALTESPWRSQLRHRGLNTATGLDDDL